MHYTNLVFSIHQGGVFWQMGNQDMRDPWPQSATRRGFGARIRASASWACPACRSPWFLSSQIVIPGFPFLVLTAVRKPPQDIYMAKTFHVLQCGGVGRIQDEPEAVLLPPQCCQKAPTMGPLLRYTSIQYLANSLSPSRTVPSSTPPFFWITCAEGRFQVSQVSSTLGIPSSLHLGSARASMRLA